MISKATIDHLDALWINHVLVTIGSRSLQQSQSNAPGIDNLALLTNVVDRVGQVRSEEAAEVDGMTTDNDIILVDAAKDKVAELVHPLQTIGIDRLVADVERHIRLLGVDILEGTYLGGPINERGLDGVMSRGDAESVGISRNLLKAGDHQDLIIGIAGQPLTEAAGHGAQCPTEAGAQQLGGRCTGVAPEDAHEFGLLLGPLGRIGRIARQELGQFIDLRQTEVANGTIKEPTVHLSGEGEIDLIHHGLDKARDEAKDENQCRSMVTLIECIIPVGLAAEMIRIGLERVRE